MRVSCWSEGTTQRANERTVWHRLYERRLRERKWPTLNVGDRVGLNQKHRPFQKGYLSGWTEEVFSSDTYDVGRWLPTRFKSWTGPRGRNILSRGFAKSPRAGRCEFGVEKSAAQTRTERVGALEGLAPKIRQLDSQDQKRDQSPRRSPPPSSANGGGMDA